MNDGQLLVAMRALVLLLVAASGPAVVLTRAPAAQAVAVSFYGLLLALMFFLFQAPDVALSQIVVGAVALPLMVLLALVKIRRNTERRRIDDERTRAGGGEEETEEARA